MSYRYCYDCQSRCDSDDICHNCLDNAERELKTHAEGTKEFHFDGERFLNASQGPETEAHSPLPTGEGPGVGWNARMTSPPANSPPCAPTATQ